MHAVQEMIGLTMVSVSRQSNSDNNDGLRFESEDGRVYWLAHQQDCCESVSIEEIHGYLEDLVGSPIITAEEFNGSMEPESEFGDYTFYRFATAKGWVTVRFYGESEYYGTSAYLYKESH